MYLKWSKKLFGEDNDIDDTGYNSVEIDESEIIDNQNIKYWMFE